MRKNIEITGIIADSIDIEKIKMLMEAAGIAEINVRTIPQYDDWLSNLPIKTIPGLSGACLEWIRHWGNGGGDLSSETCITDAIKTLESDIPAELADAIYNRVAGYSKSDFDAAGLTIEMIDGCIKELEIKNDCEGI